MHLPTKFTVQNTGKPQGNADVAEIVDDVAKNPTNRKSGVFLKKAAGSYKIVSRRPFQN